MAIVTACTMLIFSLEYDECIVLSALTKFGTITSHESDGSPTSVATYPLTNDVVIDGITIPCTSH